MTDFVPILDKIIEHALETPQRECCGFAVVEKGKLRYFPCRNVATSNTEFIIHPEDYVRADELGIVGVVHSHLNGSPMPSMADLVGCEQSGLPWFIVAIPNGAYHRFEPTHYKAPLHGRPFVHGVLDCFSLARDYYAEIGVEVLDFEREDEWWLKDRNLLTVDNFEKAGFRVVTDGTLQEHDGVIMQNGKTDRPNHVGVYLGDGVMLHHTGDRLSCKTPYGGYWAKNTVFIVRHVSKC